jgi:uncharacterized protein (DUF2267 family)
MAVGKSETNVCFRSVTMSTTGLEVFDTTVQATNKWLNEICEVIGPDRQRAYDVLRAVLHSLRDRLTVDQAAHLGSQLPMLVRGIYFEGWKPSRNPQKWRSREDFLAHVNEELRNIRPTDAKDGSCAVFRAINHHIDPGEAAEVVQALPKGVRTMWPIDGNPTSA